MRGGELLRNSRSHDTNTCYHIISFGDYNATTLNKLTYDRRLRPIPERWKPEFFLPVNISSKRTPKLKTSDLLEYNPSIAYSGAMYPLSRVKGKYKFNKS